MKKILTLALILASSAPTFANNTVGYIYKSNHGNTNKNYNEKNPGIYVISDKFIAGTYKNSYNDQAFFVGSVSDIDVVRGYVRFSLWYGGVYGYGWNSGMVSASDGGAKLLPMIVPTVSFGYGGYYVNTHIVGNAIAVSTSFEF